MPSHADKMLDTVTAKIVDLLIQNPTIHYNKAQLVRHAGVSRDALYDRLDGLVAYDILEPADVDMDRTYYRLNPESTPTNAVATILYPDGDGSGCGFEDI